MPIFLGSDFIVISVTRISDNVLRVKFGQVPLAVDTSGVADATNPSNYELTGSAFDVAVVGARKVFGDPLSIDLFTNIPLATGTWTVTVNDAVAARDGGTYIQVPKSGSVSVTTNKPTETVAQGASNHSQTTLIRRFFNPALKGPNWDAVIAGLAAGDEIVAENAQLAFLQLYSSTASGTFLDQRAADDGVGRPEALGLSDDQFRNYKIKLTQRKLTHDALLQMLEIFYGIDAVRAYITSSKYEPYELNDQDDLQLLIDEKTSFTCTFTRSDFSNPAEGTAIEVCAVINRSLRAQRLGGYATPIQDPVTGNTYIRIYSPTLGLASAMRCSGGKAQSWLWFPDRLDVYTGTPLWSVDYSPSTGYTTFESTTSGALRTWMLRPGDYVNIYGDDFDPDNQGSFEIVEVFETYIPSYRAVFKIVNTAAVSETDKGAYAEAGMTFFRPSKQTIQAGDRTVALVQQGSTVEVSLPATTIAVARTLLEAAYLQIPVSKEISELTRNVDGTMDLTVPSTSGLTVGGQVVIEGCYGTTDAPEVTDAVLVDSKTAASLKSIWSVLADTSGSGCRYHTVTKIGDGRAILMGGATSAPVVRDTVESFQIVSSFAGVNDSTGYEYEWATLTSMPAARKHHTASYLPDSGRIFVYGGINGGGAAPEAWFFIPAPVGTGSGAWLDAAPGDDRAGHAATVLESGDVFVSGGIGGGGTGLATAAVYSPGDNSWTACPDMTWARAQHSQILLDDGRVLVTGGRAMASGSLDYAGGSLGIILHRCEIYNPTGDVWANTGFMSKARFGHALVLLPDNRVLAIGGQGYNPTQTDTAEALSSTEIWDPNTGRWTPGPKMNYARELPVAFYLASKNAVYVAGGDGVTQGEFLDLDTMQWQPSSADMSESRLWSKGVLLNDDLVLLTGGMDGVSTAVGNYLLLPGIEKWLTGGLNGIATIQALPDSTTVTVGALERKERVVGVSLSNATIYAATAPERDYEGPYILNPKSGPVVTGEEATLDVNIAAGAMLSSLQLSAGGADTFPDEDGWLVIGLGTDYQTSPIKYFGRLSSDVLALDPSFRFPNSIPRLAKVSLLYTKGNWVPTNAETLGSFYLTASSSGRVAAVAALRFIFAAGNNLDINIAYPSDRGLGGEGLPTENTLKLSDLVTIYSSDEVDKDIAEERGE